MMSSDTKHGSSAGGNRPNAKSTLTRMAEGNMVASAEARSQTALALQNS